MESQRFDTLSRLMASNASRRTVLRGVFGGALAGISLRAGASAAPAPKIEICHYDADSGTYSRISVSTNALDAHLAHGDNGNAGCPDGYIFDMETCACILEISAYACDEFNVTSPSCGTNNRGFCVTTADQTALVCIGSAGCIDCDNGTCADGWVCVSDGGCGGDHCHPLYA